jgi:hypothetical protein
MLAQSSCPAMVQLRPVSFPALSHHPPSDLRSRVSGVSVSFKLMTLRSAPDKKGMAQRPVLSRVFREQIHCFEPSPNQPGGWQLGVGG